MYAQNGEDDHYYKYLDLSKSNGKYLDIGAGKPLEISNTQLLYEKGWRGLCVDAHPQYAIDWAKERPRDIFVNTAIMDKNQSFTMTDTVIEGSWLHSIYLKEGYKTYQTQAITLAALLEQYPDFYDIDLFTLDVELSESKVLATADFTKFTPKLIIIEKCIRGIDSKPLWEHKLTPFYKPVEEFPGNTFYLRNNA